MAAAQYTGPEPTLDEMRAQSTWVWASCALPCGHCAAIPLAPVVRRVGAHAPAQALRSRLRCTICGKRGAEIPTPSWSGLQTGWAKLPLERVPVSLMRAMADDALTEIGATRQ